MKPQKYIWMVSFLIKLINCTLFYLNLYTESLYHARGIITICQFPEEIRIYRTETVLSSRKFYFYVLLPMYGLLTYDFDFRLVF